MSPRCRRRATAWKVGLSTVKGAQASSKLRSSANRASARASSSVVASGFSTSTCLPASREARTIGPCCVMGVRSTTASTSDRERAWEKFVVNSAEGQATPAALLWCSRRTGEPRPLSAFGGAVPRQRGRRPAHCRSRRWPGECRHRATCSLSPCLRTTGFGRGGQAGPCRVRLMIQRLGRR